MRLRNLVALFLSVVLFAPSPVAAQAPDARPDPAANAAVQYAQAFALLPALDKDQQKILHEWNKVPLDAATLKLIDKSRNSRLYLHRGAKLRFCDWGLDYADGIRLLLPHAPKARALALLTALHARHEFEQGHWKAGWQDVTDLLALARHLEKDAIMIVQLVGYSIEAMAIESAAPYLPDLKAALPESASAVLEKLPARPTLRQMVLAEKRVAPVWLIEELKKAERHKKGSWREVWKEFFDVPTEGGEAPGPEVKAVKTFEQAVKMLEDLLPYYDQLVKMTALPWKEFDAQYPAFIKKAKAASPVAGYVLPAMNRVAEMERRSQAKMALFRAALAVVQGGKDRLKDIKDPFGDGPFEYRAVGKGFELKSKLIFKGKPVTLTVGKGKKE